MMVFPVGEDPPDSVRVPTHRELAVGTEASLISGITRRNEHRDQDLDLWIESLSVHVAAGVGNRLLEQLDVGVESDGLDVSVLRLTEQCAEPRTSMSRVAMAKPEPRSSSSWRARRRTFAVG